jgi:hypothetical protein
MLLRRWRPIDTPDRLDDARMARVVEGLASAVRALAADATRPAASQSTF